MHDALGTQGATADAEAQLSQSVASVTVAFNAKGVLPRHIEALTRQTRPIQEIVVVDNASTDGTAAWLGERYPQVTVLRMAENLGAGGALAAGMKYAALERRHDWLWLFDDDSVPKEDALEVLVDRAESARVTDNRIGIVAPLCVHEDTGACYTPLFWRNGYVKPSPEFLKKPTWFADLVINAGSMVHREVVEKIGLPRADFFMDFFDFEYCLRAGAQGYRVLVVSDSKLLHEIGATREVRVLGYVNRWMDHAPWREYYISRNMTYVAWWLYPNWPTKRFVLRHLVRHGGGVLLFGSHKLACLKRMVQGFRDGVRGSLGIRFRPG
jgi:GT2 family glycosyltransferase